MTVDELKKNLAEKETLKERTEIIFHRLIGQIELLKEQIQKEEEKNKVQAG